jgi:asparagine synthase (glutamine-hydrolysing)
MSAIAGILYLDRKPVEQNHLTKMLDILEHRGSDGANIWSEGNVGFIHRMLWTTPESLLETLPLEKGNLVITADARIDNRDELISALKLSYLPKEKITDSDLILAAYQKWGKDCPDKLLGDFAFAIWDKQKQQLFCARDHFGVKPFYYYSSETAFVFATEIKGIFCFPQVPRQINETRIGDYLSSMFHDAKITSYKHILRLPPASWMIVNLQETQIQSYWSLDPTREIKLSSDEEYATKFREIFTEAVRCRLRSAYSIGSTLSGGLDSSSVTCTARKLLQSQEAPPLHTFSAVFDELEECDERQYINPILEQGGLRSHFVYGDKINPFSELDRAFWHQDEAFYAPNWSMTWTLYAKAKEEGIPILLDGFDGDTTVSDGYGYLSELAKAGRWLSLARQTKELAKTFKGSFRQWYWSYIRQYGIKPTIEKYQFLKSLKRISNFLLKSSKPQENISSKQSELSSILNRKFIERINLSASYQTGLKTKSNFGQDERERHYRNIISGQSAFALEVMDKSMAAFGIEPRYPFWDKRLVEFCLALPPEQKLNMGWNRVVMRRAMKDILPVKVQWRRGKTNFSSNLVRGLRCLDRKEWDKFVTDNLAILQEYIDLAALEKIYQRYSSVNLREASQDARTLWIVISLVLWLNYVTKDSQTISSKKEAVFQTN